MAKSFTTPAPQEVVERTQQALEKGGIASSHVVDGAAALGEVRRLVPKGASILSNTSRTLEDAGILGMIEGSEEYDGLLKKFMQMQGKPERADEKRRMGAAPDYAIGSALAVTQAGELFWASSTGSQLGGYAFGAGKVVLVVSTHKIAKDLDEAHERLHTHVFPLEDARAKEAYGTPSAINKELVIRGEKPGRIHVVFVDEVLGF